MRNTKGASAPFDMQPLWLHSLEITMFTWGVIVFLGLWLIFRDVDQVKKAKLMGSPMIIHIIVIGSGLAIHGGSADGAMAAIVSGVFSALYVRVHQRWYGYIRKNIWYPGILRANDPRGTT